MRQFASAAIIPRTSWRKSAHVKTLKTLEPLTTRLLEIKRIQSAASVLSWDQETYMPAGGGAARAEQIATLEGLAHERLVSPQIESFLTEWIDPTTGQAADTWDEPSRSLLREVWRDFRKEVGLQQSADHAGGARHRR